MNQGTIIKFNGHSDDVIEWEMIIPSLSKVTQGQITASSTSDYTRILVQTIGGARGVYVFALYDGCWHFSVRQFEEGRKIPHNWEITIDQMDGHEFSARICIDAFKLAQDVLAVPELADWHWRRENGKS
jgi:hypothetical protein